MNIPYGTTIFCEDIRDEISGKKTYVGVYLQEMIISGSFPALIPQFAMAITYLEPIDLAIFPVTVKISVPDSAGGSEIVADVDLPVEFVATNNEADRDPHAQYRGHIFHFKISPFLIQGEGYVKVRAYHQDQETKLGSLRIRLLSENEINPTQPNDLYKSARPLSVKIQPE